MKKAVFALLFFILFYTRFIGLDWGLPYPMHPDERNMADAIVRLECKELSSCLNPHFFAYGQLPLYLSYASVQMWHFFHGTYGQPISFIEATISLRIISAISSICTAYVLLKIIELFTVSILKRKAKSFFSLQLNVYQIAAIVIITFSPYFIQFSHFGTTESLLMFFYSLIVYFSIKIIDMISIRIHDVIIVGIILGLSIGTKVSAVLFIPPVIMAIGYEDLYRNRKKKFTRSKLFFMHSFLLAEIAAVFFVISSPHTLFSFKEFLGSMNYESAVARGAARVFYTRQFENAIPIIFQLQKIMPYAFGWSMYLLASVGFFVLSWRDRRLNVLRIAFITFFLPSAFLYAKWTRFLAPIFPLVTVFGILFLFQCLKRLKNSNISNVLLGLITLVIVLPGIAYISIYSSPDSRFMASKWIYEHIPSRAYILSETANVVDIPLSYLPKKMNSIPINQYNVISFNFYDLDSNIPLQTELRDHIARADYIFVPSRRLFMNNVAKYPKLNDYYQALFSGSLGFKEVAKITSYPKISLFGKTLFEFPDENAEETWTVFDHPVIRIYKRI